MRGRLPVLHDRATGIDSQSRGGRNFGTSFAAACRTQKNADAANQCSAYGARRATTELRQRDERDTHPAGPSRNRAGAKACDAVHQRKCSWERKNGKKTEAAKAGNFVERLQ